MGKIIVDDNFLYTYMHKAEEEMLSQIPSESEICHKFSSEFDKKMNELLKYEKRTLIRKNIVRCLKITVASILIICIVSFG